MGIYDVPAGMLIEEAAKDLKTRVKKPAFTDYAKTGAHKERSPNNPDWFYTRMAAVLYRTYKEGVLGTGRLRTYFGGRKNRGVRPEHKVKASGKILRVCLQLLEKEGLVKKDKKGRKITSKGEKFLFDKSKVAQVAFDEKIKLKQTKADEDAQKRVANRAKALQAANAPPAAPFVKGSRPVPSAQAGAASAQTHAAAQGAQHAHTAAKPAEPHAPAKPAEQHAHTAAKPAGHSAAHIAKPNEGEKK